MNLPCASWPVRERQRPVAVGARPERLPRTLVVAAERDGATPYEGALELQRRLGAGASLVTETGPAPTEWSAGATAAWTVTWSGIC